MATDKKKIVLGFTDQEFEHGAHICQIFSDDNERHDVLVNYIVSGLKTDESTACFSENETQTKLKDFFNKNGLRYQELEQSGQFSLSKTAEVYFENEEFVPEKMLSLLKEFYINSQKEEHSGARVIGEMSPEIETISGGERLLEYECMVTNFQKEFPVTAVCQYDARKFDGATIMDVLKVHPHMVVKGKVVSNPFFVDPQECLDQKKISK